MSSTVLAGVLVASLSGLVMGTSPWPLKLMRRFKYEQFAFISMLVALLILPWVVTLSFCPNAISAYRTVEPSLLIKSNVFSLGWGIAQILALLCFVRIGVSLTYGILCAIGASVGVITPMVFKASGLFRAAPDLTSYAGLTVLCGVAVMVVGVSLAAMAGFGREKLQQAESRSGGFGIGLAMVIAAGVLSAGWSFAFVYSQAPIIQAMKARGAGDIAANFAVWAVALLGAAVVNVLYPACLMTRNKSWRVLVANKKEAVLAVIYGLQFFAASALLGKGMLLLGAFGASVGFGVTQGMLILGGQALGFASGEWRGVTGRPLARMYRAIAILLVAMLILAFGNSLARGGTSENKSQTLNDAVTWLEGQSKRMIRECRRTMKNGASAFPPQVGSHYKAFWLRDYAYMLEGYVEGFTDKELTDACLLFVNAQRADGACVDCVKYDGTPIYKPGYGSMGENPVADGSQFTVDVAWRTYRKTQDRKLVRRIIDRLVKAMDVVPRNPETGLVYIKPGKGWDRCPYGFTDTVRKQGDVLFSSLLYVQASRRLADLLDVAGRTAEARKWQAKAERVAESIRKVFWDEKLGLFRAATAQCNQPDIWGSAFAVYLHVATQKQASAVARYFKEHYGEIVQHGQVRHLPGGVYWERAGGRDGYQNGAFWATPTGWFVYTLDLADPKLADQTVLDMVSDFRRRGITEWCFGEKTAVPDYLSSATLPLAGIRKMLQRRRR